MDFVLSSRRPPVVCDASLVCYTMAAATSPDVDIQHTETPPFDDAADAAEQSPAEDDADEIPAKPASAPMQKRRRVTRAWYALPQFRPPASKIRPVSNTSQRRVQAQEDQVRREAALHALHRV